MYVIHVFFMKQNNNHTSFSLTFLQSQGFLHFLFEYLSCTSEKQTDYHEDHGMLGEDYVMGDMD